MNNVIVQPVECKAIDIFKDIEYIIPIYQRNYAWGRDEIEQLINDINDIPLGFEGKYYLGSLIVNQVKDNLFEVIDGQQRLTTLFLILSYLNNDNVKGTSLGFEARKKSNVTLQKINDIKDNTCIKKGPWYSDEIISGYEVVINYFEGKNQVKNEFYQKLNNVIIIRTQVPQNIDLNHYFEIMNTRGEQLELHEIVKAKILSAIKSEDGTSEQDRKDKIIAATIWDACAQMNKYVQMCFQKDIREKLFGDKEWDNFECKSFVDVRNAFGELENKEKRFTLLSKLTKPEKNNALDSTKNEDDMGRFESIISFPNFLLQVNKLITDNEDDASLDDKQLVKKLERYTRSKNDALTFIFSLLKYRYLFDRFIVKREYKGDYSSDGKWSLLKLNTYTDRKGTKPVYVTTFGSDETLNDKIKLLESCLRITYTAPKTMHWISKALSSLDESENGSDLLNELEKYCCSKLKEAKYREKTGFEVERIVFTYLDYILCRDNPSKFNNYQFQFRTSIEHFYPRNPDNDRNDVDKNNRDSFGNLALITAKANSEFSNRFPNEKIEHYEENIKQSPKLMLMAELVNENDKKWDDGLVDKHKEEMIKILDKEVNVYFPMESN